MTSTDVPYNHEVTYECYVTVRVEVYDHSGTLTEEQIEQRARDQAIKDIAKMRADELHVEYEALL